MWKFIASFRKAGELRLLIVSMVKGGDLWSEDGACRQRAPPSPPPPPLSNAGCGTLFNIVVITGASGCQQNPSLPMVAMAKGNVDVAANALEATGTAPNALGIVVAAVGCRAVAIVRPIDAVESSVA
ncbi:hypothetical protein TSMEX_011294 [Taenia solium]|eukprot:TsM_001054200 transcript=TsM_001054200 gene=TsM_001054200